MNRRTFLVASGALVAGSAGCLGRGTDGDADSSPTGAGDSTADSGAITAETDGYPDESVVETPAESRDVDPDSFETAPVDDVTVPLVPVDVAHYWYRRRDARFVDARGDGQYDASHVVGAVLSPARRVENWDRSRDGPTTAWSTGDRIVCYCGCPHHLSTLRAGEFLSEGYENVYAIDEGFFAWRDRGYPVTGDQGSQASYVVRGRTDPADAGGYAWATHGASDQQEAAPIDSDGRYRLELHFDGVEAASPVQLRTPSYELTAPLSDLTDGVVSGSV